MKKKAAKNAENRRWTVGGVTYATLNIRVPATTCATPHRTLRNIRRVTQANIVWMQHTFAEAKARHSAAIMFISQADPGFDATDATRGPVRDPNTLGETDGQPDGYQEFLVALRDQVISFAKPVAYVHGDSHYFRIDKPFLNTTEHASKISRAWKLLATTRRTASMTCTGSRSWSIPAAARFSRTAARKTSSPGTCNSGPGTMTIA